MEQVKGHSKIGGWNCKVCNKNFRIRRDLEFHLKNDHPNRKKITANIQGDFYCKYCKRHSTTKSGNSRHEKYCNENPNKIKYKGHSMKPFADKISKTQKKNYANGKSRWYIDRSQNSYAENYFIEFLNKFTEYKHNYWVDRFYLDFAWPEKMIYFEVNGQQHYEEKYIERDKKRKEKLGGLGWKCLAEIKWSWYKGLNKEDQIQFLNELKNSILGSKEVEIRWKNNREKYKEKMIEKYGIENPKYYHLTKNEIMRRKDLLSNYDRSKWGWKTKAVKETGISRRQIDLYLYYESKGD